jgi:signal transduction histidine kinase
VEPILDAHRTPRPIDSDLIRLQELLGARTAELAANRVELRHGVLRRKALEAKAAKTGRLHKKSLHESLLLQKRLRQLTHRILAAQEDERRKISRELHDEIAQTLLGINVRLLALKTEARTNSRGFKNEIARTQRLVVKSAQSVRRVAREFRNP